MYLRTVTFTTLLGLFATSTMAATLDLRALADNGSRFVEYRQGAFWELGRTRQSDRVNDPDGAFTYSQLPNYVPQGGGGIAFPKKRNFSNLGTITYDEATGEVTDVDVDFAQYVAPSVFTYYQAVAGGSAYTTSFNSFTGAVTFNATGSLSVNLTSEIAFTINSTFDGAMIYTGSFEVVDNAFTLSVDDVQNSRRFETQFPGDGDVRLIWNVTGGLGPRGDFDGDGDVDGADFLNWQAGNSSNGPLNADDLANWKTNFGATWTTSSPSSLPVPEPCDAVLLLTFLAVVSAKRNTGASLFQT